MKSCPTCNRTYKDDTLVFCLDDGARLSGAYDPAQYNSDLAKTAILPPDRMPSNKTSEPQPTIAAVTSGAYGHSTTPNELTGKGGNSLWIILGGTIALVVVGLMIVLGYFVLKTNDNRLIAASAPSPNGQTDTGVQTNANVHTNGTGQPNSNAQVNSNAQANTNVQANSDAQTNSNVPANANVAMESTPPDDILNWLEGVWTGEGYQSDTRTTWIIVLTVHDGTFSVEYPNIPCRGVWNLTSKNSRGGSFTESITQGTDRCVNNERVIIEKVNDAEISCKFLHAGSRNVIATAVLTKKAQ